MKGKDKVQKNTQGKPAKKIPVKRTENKTVSKLIWIVLAGIFITTFIIYLKAIGNNLLMYWDDHLYITNNDHIKELNWMTLKLIFSNFYVCHYQPLTMLLYAFEYKIGNGHAGIFHFVNILIHLCNTYLVFAFISKISPKNIWVALITAAFFAVHPMHVESVAWVAERKDVLYAFFFLFSLIMYTKYLTSESYKHLALAGVLFVLSCLSKSAAVVLPLVLLLLDYYTGRRIDRKLVIEKIPFFAVSLIFGLLAVYSQKSSGIIENWAPDTSFIERLSIVAYSFSSYIFKAVVPIQLSAVYPYPAGIGSTLPFIYYFSVLFAGIVLFMVWFSKRWGKEVIFGFLFFIITIIMVMQFIPVGMVTMADRYTYIPYIGIFFILGKLYERISTHLNPQHNKYVLIIILIFFIVFSAVAYQGVKKWESDETLFSDVIEKYPNCTIAYLNRGAFYNAYYAKYVYADDKALSDSYFRKAVSDFENVLKCEPIEKIKWRAYYNLGCTLGDLGDYEGSVKNFDKSIALNPDHYAYQMRGAHFLNYYANKVHINDSSKRKFYIQKSISDFESSLKLTTDPNYKIQLYKNIAIAFIQMGDYAGAIRNYDKIIEIDGNNTDAYVKRSDARYQLKDYQGALDDCNKAIELNPQDINTIKNRDYVKSIVENSVK